MTGALFRMHHGLTNFVFGGVYGGILGLTFFSFLKIIYLISWLNFSGILGSAFYLSKKLTRTTYEENRYRELRKEAIHKKYISNLVIITK